MLDSYHSLLWALAFPSRVHELSETKKMIGAHSSFSSSSPVHRARISKGRDLLMMVAWAAMCLSACSCGPVHLSPIETRAPGQYVHSQKVNDLYVAVETYTDPDALREHFGQDLRAAGLLTMLVVVKNLSLDQIFIIERQSFALVPRRDGHLADEQAIQGGATLSRHLKTQQQRENAGATTALSSGLALAPIAFIPLVPILTPFQEKQYNDTMVTGNALVRNELTEKTLYPGQMQHGFVYFSLPSDVDLSEVEAVKLEAKNVRSNETLTFTIPLDVNHVK